MTALDRAKCFLKSSKTKTALKLLPFALAAGTATAGTLTQTNFGMYLQGYGGGAAVPEPASIVLLTAGVAGTAAYKVLKGRKKNK